MSYDVLGSDLISYSHIVLCGSSGCFVIMPARHLARTLMLCEFEHFVSYAGSASIPIAGYGDRPRPGSVACFGYTQAFWSIFNIFRRADSHQSQILRLRLSKRSSGGSSRFSSWFACGRARIWTSSD
jgi:hypothetical protein